VLAFLCARGCAWAHPDDKQLTFLFEKSIASSGLPTLTQEKVCSIVIPAKAGIQVFNALLFHFNEL